MSVTVASENPAAPHLAPLPERKSVPRRSATDDEILGLASASSGRKSRLEVDPVESHKAKREASPRENRGVQHDDRVDDASDAALVPAETAAEPENLRGILEANPDIRRAWHDAQSYRETFATPEEARAATAVLADLDRMDALFYSRRPEDHAELARAVAALDPVAFTSLAAAMAAHAASGVVPPGLSPPPRIEGRSAATQVGDGGEARLPDGQGSAFASSSGHQQQIPRTPSRATESHGQTNITRDYAREDNSHEGAQRRNSGLSTAQAEFFHAANAAAVEGVLDAIESQVERLLPEGVSKSARHRVVGEIYRELDTTLRSNRQLAQQMRDAFASGALDAEHQRAIVSLVTGRARQALPGVAKRVLNEWTSTIVAVNQDRRARQRAAERRVDIAGSGGAGNDARRSLAPRDLDYARLSDADILNL